MVGDGKGLLSTGKWPHKINGDTATSASVIRNLGLKRKFLDLLIIVNKHKNFVLTEEPHFSLFFRGSLYTH